MQDATNFSVPEYVDVMSEMKITPGCTYEIVVESNPNDGKRKASLNYTVPGRSILEVVGDAVNPLAYTDVPETAGLARSINP